MTTLLAEAVSSDECVLCPLDALIARVESPLWLPETPERLSQLTRLAEFTHQAVRGREINEFSDAGHF